MNGWMWGERWDVWSRRRRKRRQQRDDSSDILGHGEGIKSGVNGNASDFNLEGGK